MRIGSAWTRTSEKDNKTFISVALDETVLELFPQLRGCNISLSHISKEDRTSEKSPAWYVNLSKRRNEATQEAKENASEGKEEEIKEDEIPF